MFDKKSYLVAMAFVVWVLFLSPPILAQEACSGTSIFTEKTCKGDEISAAERNLFELVNKYRTANGYPALQLSSALSMVGNRRMLDLNQNVKSTTHSWSNCPYDINDQKTWPCLTEAPRRLNSGYKGVGYETLYRTSGVVSPDAALKAWQNSSLHSSIILNQGMFQRLPWDEIGVAIDGSYASLWFGHPSGKLASAKGNSTGLGVSLDQTISGLTRFLSSNNPTGENNIWQGISADKTVKLDISGTRNETSHIAATFSNSNGRLDMPKKQILSTLLKNVFPEWNDLDVWIDNSLAQITQNPTAWRTKVVRNLAVEIKGEGYSNIKLTIKPQVKSTSVEIY